MIADMDAGWVGSTANEVRVEPGRWEGKKKGKPSLRSLEKAGSAPLGAPSTPLPSYPSYNLSQPPSISPTNLGPNLFFKKQRLEC